MNYNIAIDGPAGAGKSTIAKKIASVLSYVYIDTGAMYRAMACYYLDHGVASDDEQTINSMLDDIDIGIVFEDGAQHVLLNGNDVTGIIRQEQVGNMASSISVFPEVRKKLVELQRTLAKQGNVIMDGRDIGTVVLPDAALKIYLTASVEERARRRYTELIEKGQSADIEAIKRDIEERDTRDMTRKESPLKKADDAIEVDSSDLNIDEVVNVILRHYFRLFNIETAENAGFCFGVTRAVNMLYENIEKGKKNIFTLGPIIHNEMVVADLEEKGVKVINSPDEIEGIDNATVVIRSHGVSEKVYETLKANHSEVIDATCPFVARIHEAVRNESRDGRKIVIIGDAKHPEVEGTMGWSESACTVISETGEARSLSFDKNDRIFVVAQTTFNLEKFNEIVEIVYNLGYDIKVLNTICSSTATRQTEAASLAGRSDIMLVLGSRSSSNTGKLYDICKERCENTYFIEAIDEMDSVDFRADSNVGITAGASTPNYFIQEVSLKCQKNKVLKNCSNQL